MTEENMLTDLISSLPALFFILFLPGYALVSALFPKKPLGWGEKILAATVLSITLNILASLALDRLLNTPVKLDSLLSQNAAFILFFSAIYLLRLRRLPRIYLELHEYKTEKFLKMPAVILLVLSTALLTYSVHQNYQFPFLPEEWNHIAEANRIAENSQIDGNLIDVGFRILLAQVFLVTGQTPAYYSAYLPMMFAGIAALGIYEFTKKTTENTHIALLSMLFFAGVKSNWAFSGAWFLTPIALSAGFTYAVLYFLASGFNEKNKAKIRIAGFLTLGLTLIDPISAAFAAAAYLIYLLIRRKEAKGIILETATYYLITLTALFFTLSPAPTREINPPIEYPIFYYGIIPFILALLGAHYAIKKRGSHILLLSWASLMLASLLITQISGTAAMIPYRETAYNAFLILAALSACGLYAILEKVNIQPGTKLVAAMIPVLLISASAYVLFQGYYDAAKTLPRPMDDRTYDAFNWLAKTKGNRSIVLTRPQLAPMIPAINSNLTTLGTTDSNDTYDYFMSDCSVKKGILKKHDVAFVLVSADDKVDCDFLPWIYTQKGIYIYEVDRTLLG